VIHTGGCYDSHCSCRWSWPEADRITRGGGRGCGCIGRPADRRECLDQIVVPGQRHLRRVPRTHVHHNNTDEWLPSKDASLSRLFGASGRITLEPSWWTLRVRGFMFPVQTTRSLQSKKNARACSLFILVEAHPCSVHSRESRNSERSFLDRASEDAFIQSLSIE
jgi:hypothetical protein